MIRNTQSVGKNSRMNNHAHAKNRQLDRRNRKGWGTWESRQSKKTLDLLSSEKEELVSGIEEYHAMLADKEADALAMEQQQTAEVHYFKCHGPDGQFVYERDMPRVRKVA